MPFDHNTLHHSQVEPCPLCVGSHEANVNCNRNVDHLVARLAAAERVVEAARWSRKHPEAIAFKDQLGAALAAYEKAYISKQDAE